MYVLKSFFNRVLLFILIFVLFFNFVNSYESYASATAVIGSVELLEFLLLCASVGIGFKALDEAQAMLEEFNRSQFKFLDEEPNRPPGMPDPRAKKVILTLLGVNLGLKIKDLVDNIKGFFESIGAKKGDNAYSNISFYDEPNSGDGFYYETFKLSGVNVFRTKRHVVIIEVIPTKKNLSKILVYINEKGPLNRGNFLWRTDVSNGYIRNLSLYDSQRSTRWGTESALYVSFDYDIDIPGYSATFNHEYRGVPTGTIIDDSVDDAINRNSLHYTVSPDSYIFGGSIDEKSPNIAKIPSDKVSSVMTPDGKIKNIYDGSIDDFIQDIAENTTLDDFYSDSKQKIDIDTEGKIVFDIDTEVPYPDIQETPEEVSIGLGKIIALLQRIVNWLSRIFNTMANFFVVPDDLDLDFSSFKGADLREKFPWCIPFDLKDSFSSFAQQAKNPSFDIDLDTEYFSIHHTIDYSFMTFFIGFFRYACIVFFSVFLMSKTRDLIKW